MGDKMKCKHNYHKEDSYSLFHPTETERGIFGNYKKVIGYVDVFFCPCCGNIKTNVISFTKLEKQLSK